MTEFLKGDLGVGMENGPKDGMVDVLEIKEKPCHVDPVIKCAILGVSQVMSQISEAAVLIHGPKGCAFPTYEATIYDKLLFNFSEMCERSVIFGGEEQLLQKIYDTYHDNVPSIMSVITTCSSEIIGDDVNGVIDQASDLELPILRMEGVGFKRDNWESIDHAMTELVKWATKGVKRREIVKDETINLICHIGTSIRWKDEVESIEDTLKILGRPIRKFLYQNDLEDIIGIEKACLNVQINVGIGSDTVQYMKQRFGTPFIKSSPPVGLENTVEWVKNIANFLEINIDEELEDRAKDIKIKFRQGLGRVKTFRPFEIIQRAKVLIIGEPDIAIAYHSLMANELDTQSTVIMKSQDYQVHDMGFLRGEYRESTFKQSIDNMEIKSMIEEIKPDIILCNDFEYLLAKPISNPAYVNITYPGGRRLKILNKPYLGFDGLLYFLEDLFNVVIEKYS